MKFFPDCSVRIKLPQTENCRSFIYHKFFGSVQNPTRSRLCEGVAKHSRSNPEAIPNFTGDCSPALVPGASAAAKNAARNDVEIYVFEFGYSQFFNHRYVGLAQCERGGHATLIQILSCFFPDVLQRIALCLYAGYSQ